MVDFVTKKNFSFDATLRQAYKTPDGKKHVVAVASDDQEDRTRDRMSKRAVRSMADQAAKNKLPLLDNHRATFGFGETFSAMAKKNEKGHTEFLVDFELDDRFPESDVLFTEVAQGKCKKQVSIGGFLNLENPNAVRFEENAQGNLVRVIDDIVLEHIATTRPGMAAVPRTRFVDAVVKDVFGNESVEETKAFVQKVLEELAENAVTDPTSVSLVTGEGSGGGGTSSNCTHPITINVSGNVVIDKEGNVRVNQPIEKAAVPFKSYPLIRGGSWSWTTAESDRLLGDNDWARYKAGHAWFDSAQGGTPEIKGAYKLPHHVVRDGGLRTHERGVIAAMGALLGARGGTNIPAGEKRGVYSHLSRHYAEFDRQPPEYRDWTADEFIKFHADQGIEIKEDFDMGENKKPEAPPEQKTDETKVETKVEAKTEAKTEIKTEAKAEDEGDNEETKKDAEKGLKALARIGRMFNADEDEEKPKLPAEVIELGKAVDAVLKLEKSDFMLPEIQRIVSALGKLLATEAVEEEQEEAKAVVDIDGIVEKVAGRFAEILKEQPDIVGTFTKSFEGLTSELAKGLTDMGQGFKSLVEKEVKGIADRLAATEKAADERLTKLEKAAGVRQSTPGQDADVATGAGETSEPKQPIQKEKEQPTGGRKPDTKNPFRGMFDGAKARYLAQQSR